MGTCLSAEEPFVESLVCREDELEVGVLREVKLKTDGGKEGSSDVAKTSLCVVVKDKEGRIHALSGKCTHAGANLAKGSYSDGVIRCPWHGACFDVATGDLEDFPGLDSLQKYEVSVTDDGQVKVRAKKALLDVDKRVRAMGSRDPYNGKTIVVVGGGAAAQACVETLRQDSCHFTGRIVMATADANLPYDRTKLSKLLNASHADLRLRAQDFFDEAGIEVMTGMEAVKVDPEATVVSFKSGQSLKYDKLILATGT